MSSYTNALIITPDEHCDDCWEVVEAFEYYLDTPDGPFVAVEARFVSDLESIPRLLRSLVPRSSEGAQAAVVHDKLYKEQAIWFRTEFGLINTRITRVRADEIFLDAMRVSGVSKLRRYTLYAGVRAGGWLAWKR